MYTQPGRHWYYDSGAVLQSLPQPVLRRLTRSRVTAPPWQLFLPYTATHRLVYMRRTLTETFIISVQLPVATLGLVPLSSANSTSGFAHLLILQLGPGLGVVPNGRIYPPHPMPANSRFPPKGSLPISEAGHFTSCRGKWGWIWLDWTGDNFHVPMSWVSIAFWYHHRIFLHTPVLSFLYLHIFKKLIIWRK